jgi:GTP cyclohydrolase I
MPRPNHEARAKIAERVREILELLGVPVDADPELAETPDRVAALALELTRGSHSEPEISLLPDERTGAGLVVARDLPFHSLCTHHLLPFFGRAHVGYLPGEGVVGVGAIARVVDHFASRLQLQERLGEQIAEFVEREAMARGVIVVVEARQLCMEMRGARKPGVIESTAARGELESGELRREFFERLRSRTAESFV